MSPCFHVLKDEGHEASPSEAAGTKYSTGKPCLCSQTVATHELGVTWSNAQASGHLWLPVATWAGVNPCAPRGAQPAAGRSERPRLSRSEAVFDAHLQPDPQLRTPDARGHGRLCRLQKARDKPLLAPGTRRAGERAQPGTVSTRCLLRG